MKQLITMLSGLKKPGKTKRASFPIWIFALVLFTQSEPKELSSNTKDIDKVKAETLRALHLISKNLNKGAQVIKYLEHFETAQNRIMKL